MSAPVCGRDGWEYAFVQGVDAFYTGIAADCPDCEDGMEEAWMEGWLAGQKEWNSL